MHETGREDAFVELIGACEIIKHRSYLRKHRAVEGILNNSIDQGDHLIR